MYVVNRKSDVLEGTANSTLVYLPLVFHPEQPIARCSFGRTTDPLETSVWPRSRTPA